MASRIPKLGLKSAIFGSFSVAMALILGLLLYLIPKGVEGYMEERLAGQGLVVAESVLQKLGPLGSLDNREEASRLVSEIARRDPVVGYVAVIDPGGRILAHTPDKGVEVSTLAIDTFRGRGFPVTRFRLPTGQLVVSARARTAEGQTTGYALVELHREGMEAVLGDVRRQLLYSFALGFGLLAVLMWVISRQFMIRPLSSMMSVASRLSEADLTGTVDLGGAYELATLGEALNRIAASLRDTLGRVRGVSDGVAQVIEQISRTGNQVASGATTIQGRVEETSSSMVEMMASLRGIAENVEVLYQSAEESSSSIMQMAATNDEVADNVQAMAASVEETTSAIELMTVSIKQVAKNIDELLASSEETSSSMNQMDVSISQVDMNANETAKLSETVSQDAATGVEALQKTLAGIDKIRTSSQSASAVIESLGRRIQEIGNILNVIDDVAEQTNLLALNAAIIAAQAGEHGKGFAVVAEEIKELAERTGVSTKEIADLVRSIQDESRNAVSAMSLGVKDVDEGVLLGREAERALRKIYESANKSTLMVKAIARATVEQARGSKQVTGAILRIAETVQQISRASNEQARNSEQIMKSSEKMKLFTSHVQRSSQEQAHGSKQITKSIENINEMVTHLNRAQKEQTKGTEQVLKAVEAIKTVSEAQTRSVRQLEEAIESLQRQAEVLRGEVRRFRV